MSINFYNVLNYQYTTEKTTKFLDNGRCVVFKVFSKVNKRTIFKAVEFLFNVKVKSVNILNVKKFIVLKTKVKTIRKTVVWKKAIVFLQQGYVINFTQFK